MANRSEKLKKRLGILTTLGVVIGILALGALAVVLHT
jgi:hypothetical protein